MENAEGIASARCRSAPKASERGGGGGKKKKGGEVANGQATNVKRRG